MTTFYSPHYGPAIGETNHFTTLLAPPPMPDIGIKHTRIRRTQAQFIVPDATNMAAGDITRLFDMKSSDRLINLYVSCDADWHTTATFAYGLYLKGVNNDGAAIDFDLFASSHDQVNEVARVDVFDTATTLADWDRGKTLWELAEIGDGSYSVDPEEDWTVAMTAVGDTTVVNAAVSMLVEAYYTAGD
jgi:hypothetical protein